MTRLHSRSGVVIYVHENSLEVAWVPTGADQGEIKSCSAYRRLSKVVADHSWPSRKGPVSSHNESGEGGGGLRWQRVVPAEHESGPSWFPPGPLFLFLLLPSSPHIQTPLGSGRR